MLEAELIGDADALAELTPEWDALAVANARPLASPAWMLGAWRHFRPVGARLHAVAVREDGRLVAIAPFTSEPKGAGRVDLRMLGATLPRIEPLAVPSREWEAAGPIASALAGIRPRADVLAFEAAPVASTWPLAIAERWPAALRPAMRRYYVQPSHVVSLRAPSFDAWLAGKSSNFRKAMRKLLRRFEQAGGSVRASTLATLDDDVDTLLRLHAARWAHRGGSALVALRDEWSATYREVGRAHLASGRLRLHVLEIAGEPVAARVSAAAGGEVVALNGGWDERHAKLEVARVGLLHAIEDAIARGDARLDLGPGDQGFKRRIADGDDPVAWTMLVLPRPRMAVTAARVAPTLSRMAAREAVRRSLSPQRIDRLRALRARVRG